MTIGETIRKMRRARDITQEDLAELLHITPQAVSRWETDATTPDVGSLIGLARIFDCTTDELLGMNAVKKEDRIKEYMDRIHEASFPGEPDGEKVIAICRDALKEYPGDFELMKKLSFELSYYAVYYEDIDPGKYTAMMQESIDLLEYITAQCTDPALLGDTYRNLYARLNAVGRKEEAKKYLKYFPTLWDSREFLEFKNGTPSETSLVNLLADQLEFYMELRIYDKNKTPEEQLELLRQLEALHTAFGYEYRPHRFLTYAWVYAGIGDAEKTLPYLKKAAQAAVMCDDPDCTVYRSTKHNHEKDNRDNLAEALADSRYDFVRDTPEFAEILGIITK